MTRNLACTLGLAALLLAGCGGDEAETTPAAATATATATTEAAATAEPEAPGGGKTAPGTKLAVGDPADVTIKPLAADYEDKTNFPIRVRVVKIEKGSLDDFKNMNLDEQQKKSTPYYVSVEMTASSKTIPVKDDDPDIRFDGIDDRGQEQGATIFIGDFERCDNKEAPNPFKKGMSYKSCLTYLVPGGGSIDEVRWSGDTVYITDPVVWR